MKQALRENELFENLDYASQGITGREFEECTFRNCDFSTANFSNFSFTDCAFENCNLSNLRLSHAKLQDVRFTNCKLLGVDFSTCHDFLLSVQFTGCSLDLAFFGKRNFKKTVFDSCSIKEANFTETDLTEASFLNCNLNGAVFQRTNLEKANLLTAVNYALDPEVNRIKKAKFSAQGALGLLAKYDIVIK
ncbi:pentapeptide repeat-containing protein [Rufibacter quisquiliarum]|uniref:Uncharacterized protein YjbI with pentapeptide repeats n=1 Tax=Rufibacter quisquiliarum TaxID=1549639 RepID=A0A839G9A1_9BACT|nr:pentapeptide repeat-containing protein [Rufibacter quisquiliarum]MBA9076054.1 uncharacterized protein YjbI with pentapeptide repeats [Rufibacter quisquiliarum]